MQVQVFSDVVCPWCYVGVSRFSRAADLFTATTGTMVDIRLRAYQLDPDAPTEPRPLLEWLADRYGDRVPEMVERVRTTAAADGLELDFDAAVAANSFDAHRLLSWAEWTGEPGMQLSLADELWRGHFAEGADISDHTTLATRAAAVGLDLSGAEQALADSTGEGEVRLQMETAHSLGIRSVPTFVIDSRYAVTGAQSVDGFRQVLAQVHADSV